ncbi:MAG: HDOD domain-containing protein [Verrucomicrobia bacterium]|nr:HDOD domain-containing protein [Verrucomicrobiota bacterium]
MKRILFVDDDPEFLAALRALFVGAQPGWEFEFAAGGEAAWELAAQKPFDAIVADLAMPGMDGAQLLTKVLNRLPRTVRILLSGQDDRESAVKLLGVAHRYLAKPCDAAELRDTLARAFALSETLANEQLQQLTSQIKSLPSLPDLYVNLLNELRRHDPSLPKIVQIISQDFGMCTKLLQLVNSAAFGLHQPLNGVEDAVTYLGVETIKGLVLTLQIFSLFQRVRIKDFSYEDLWTHSWTTGMWAKRIVVAETRNHVQAEQAFVAGLLHDVGKLVLASALPEQFQTAVSLQRSQKLPLRLAEQITFHTTHAEVGAYLLGLWGIPAPVVEAIAWHHQPQKDPSGNFSIVTAVHVASGLEHEHNGVVFREHPDLNQDYLHAIGVSERQGFWHEGIWDSSQG